MYQKLLLSLNRLHPRAGDFIALMRLDKPIGIYLLLWPTLWALWIAGKGQPSIANLLIFVTGVILMRSAGCVINDYADRKIDGHVARTRLRPLASGRITSSEAILLFCLLVSASFVLVLLTNADTVWLSFGGVALAACYPFMKRYTYYPQVVLGAAFSWGMPMAFVAQTGTLPTDAWLLYIANLLWTVAYDTYYAMTDREDDLKIGVKSTAILFGDADRAIIATLQGLALACLLLAGQRFELGVYYHLGLLVAAACGNGVGNGAAAQIDARVDATRDFLFTTYPGTRDLAASAAGVLYMPLMTEAGIFFGGAYGRGALRINDVTVDFYSTTKASYGLQIGAQQYAHALFFMTPEALADFRRSDGWAVGTELRYATPDKGGASIGKESTELQPVIALVFGQSGLIAGGSLNGIKYTRIIP